MRGLFYPRSAEGGGGANDSVAIWSLMQLELRGKNEGIARDDTQLLIPNIKVSGQPLTSEVRSKAPKRPNCVLQIVASNRVGTVIQKRGRSTTSRTHSDAWTLNSVLESVCACARSPKINQKISKKDWKIWIKISHSQCNYTKRRNI